MKKKKKTNRGFKSKEKNAYEKGGSLVVSPIGQGTHHSCIQPHYLPHKIPHLLRALRLLVFPTDFVKNIAKCPMLPEAGKRPR